MPAGILTGSLAVQLTRRRGATVTGPASERNHAWLKERGVVPVAYGEGPAACAVVLGEPARLAARGELEVPVARTYPLEQVRDAYRELEQGHTHGKIVLRPQAAAAVRPRPSPG
jgi:NADPH:quinone reductase-like Zn-dependent oxidoreductase